MTAVRATAIGGFADLALYADPDYAGRRFRRELRADLVANCECATCGAKPGQPCTRPTVMRRSVVRQLPHFGRGSPRRNALQIRAVVP